MSDLFLAVLNMSLIASYVILVVMLVRLLLKKAPKVISYALWAVVALRLIIPFSFESAVSLMPRNMNPVPFPQDIIYQQNPQINSGIEAVDVFISESLSTQTVGASVNPLQIYVGIGAYIWIIGIISLIVYSLVSIWLLKRQLKDAQLIERNILQAKNLQTPFVLGLIRPKIFLPEGLSGEERGYILLHEQTHIQRKDHLIKILAFLIVAIHWFNPLVWIAFRLMSTGMELSCDEKVLKEMKEEIKKPYAKSLLSLATGRPILNGSPLAFGEGNVKGRIRNVLNYKKPRFWLVVAAVIVVVAVGAGLLTNPVNKAVFSYEQEAIQIENLVKAFGNKLKTVSLLAPEDTIKESIKENYNEFVSLTLLEKWQDDPTNAPGRMVSSPWPERIDIVSIEKQSDSEYVVIGQIIEMTSVEMEQGGTAATKPIKLIIKKIADKWLIDDVIEGTYLIEEAPPSDATDSTRNYEKISAFLKEECKKVYSPYYELLDFRIQEYQEEMIDGNVEAIFLYTVVHKNYDRDPDTVGYIKEAKEKGDIHYQQLYDEYLQEQEMNFYFKAVINGDGSITLYSRNPAIEAEPWAKVQMSDFIISK